MCDVEKALERLIYIQHTFLEKNWDEYQRRIRVIAKGGPFKEFAERSQLRRVVVPEFRLIERS